MKARQMAAMIRNYLVTPKLIEPGMGTVSGLAEARQVGKLSASDSQSAYAIYTAAPGPYYLLLVLTLHAVGTLKRIQRAPGPRDSGTPDAKQQGQQDKASSKS